MSSWRTHHGGTKKIRKSRRWSNPSSELMAWGVDGFDLDSSRDSQSMITHQCVVSHMSNLDSGGFLRASVVNSETRFLCGLLNPQPLDQQNATV